MSTDCDASTGIGTETDKADCRVCAGGRNLGCWDAGRALLAGTHVLKTLVVLDSCLGMSKVLKPTFAHAAHTSADEVPSRSLADSMRRVCAKQYTAHAANAWSDVPLPLILFKERSLSVEKIGAMGLLKSFVASGSRCHP